MLVADHAHNPRGGDFLQSLDETERQLFRAAHDSTKATQEWLSNVEKIGSWIMKTAVLEYGTAFFVTPHAGVLWARLGAQVYLTLQDFEHAAHVILDICGRAKRGEWES